MSHRQYKSNKPIVIGTFRLGSVRVRLDADPMLEGGEFNSMEASITVGFNQNSWSEVVGILLHEALEMSLMRRGHKYRAVPVSTYDSADCEFRFDHSQFGRACADVGAFMAEASPELFKVYHKLQRKK
jgi:hypothetical protein